MVLNVHKFGSYLPILVGSSGKTTKNLIKRLAGEDIKLNITAIFTLNQIKEIINEVKSSEHILSIFSGRIYDIGLDAGEIFKTIAENANLQLPGLRW